MRLLAHAGPDKRTMQFLRERVRKTNAAPTGDAVTALSAMGPQAVPLLLQIARNPKAGGEGRRRAIEALGTSGNVHTVGKFIIETLSTEKSEALLCAACGVAQSLKLTKSVDALTRVCRDDTLADPPRMDAMWALRQLGDKKLFQTLIPEMLDPGETGWVRARAMYVLADLEAFGSVPRMLELLEDDDLIVRRQADRLLLGLSRTSKGVGFELKTIGAVSRRTEANKWREWWHKHHPELGLGTGKPIMTQADAERIRQLIAQLGHREYHKREQAQKELVKLGYDAVPALRDALNHKDPEIHHRAQLVLTEITTGISLAASDVADQAAKLAAVGKLQEASALYRILLTEHPDSADLHVALGEALSEMGKLDDAIDCFSKALKLDPNRADATKLLSQAKKMRAASKKPPPPRQPRGE